MIFADAPIASAKVLLPNGADPFPVVVQMHGCGGVQPKMQLRYAEAALAAGVAVEALVAALWPDAAHAVVARPDPKKGEQLVLFTTAPEASARELSAWGRAHGVPELMLPKDLRVLDALPLLATGKTDYVALNALARLGESEEIAA
jgi:acyl-CoA synthetase (AMP-forming)/AMP-acid ligase II